MHLKSLRLINFRNYPEETITFDPSFTAILGSNGAGKTNILEGLHYLCLTRGYSALSDAQNIRNGETFFTLIGTTGHDTRSDEVRLSYSPEGKQLSKNGKEIRRFADHIGTLPVVMVAPQDIALVWEAGEPRRRFFDQWMSQADRNYLQDLLLYNGHLKQCNVLLRQVREGMPADRDLIMLYHQRMAPAAARIATYRTRFLEKVGPVVSDFYREVSGGRESVALGLSTGSESTDFEAIWRQSMERDMAAGRITEGPHRDEYLFLMEGHEVRKFGSQGQQKSFLVALKLAAHAVISTAAGFPPLLLLDDIFEKMDDERTRNLLRLAGAGGFGQVILTDSSPDRALARLAEAGISHATRMIENGRVVAA
ncbi:MAG: DNA replication/repair protein RecF [Bacteroidota bacterium]